jgi:hypothetical protein
MPLYNKEKDVARPSARHWDNHGLWHHMRGVVFLKLDRGADAREEIRKGIRYSGTTSRMAMLYLLSFLPGTLSSNTYQLMTRFLYGLRSARAK